jgi:hypothetical protein
VDGLTKVTLDPARVRRLLNIAARWQFLARLADDLSGMTETRWEPLLFRTRDELVRCVLTFISVLEPAAPELSFARLEFADAGDVYPLQVEQRDNLVAAAIRNAGSCGVRSACT